MAAAATSERPRSLKEKLETLDVAQAAAPADGANRRTRPASLVARSDAAGDATDASSSATAAAAAAAAAARLHPLEHEWTFWFDRRPSMPPRGASSPAATPPPAAAAAAAPASPAAAADSGASPAADGAAAASSESPVAAAGGGGGGGGGGGHDHYETNLRPIGDFASVEDFWRFFNHIVKPSRMEMNANLHLFKHGVKPMWEDPANAAGGKWILVIGRHDRDRLDRLWEHVLLAMVGETLLGDEAAGDEICGAVCSRRKKADKIAVWNRRGARNNEAVIMSLGRAIKAIVGAGIELTYQVHEDSMKSGASYTNPVRFKL